MERIHGGMKKEPGLDMSVNINPLGPPNGCVNAAIRALGDIERYPDTDNEVLIKKISALYGNNPIILGNGSCELIYAISHYIGHKIPGYRALIPVPTFTEYGYAVRASGGVEIVYIMPYEDGFSIRPKDLILIAQGTDAVFICNPNNPTGLPVNRQLLEELAAGLEKKGGLLVVDECFLRFSDLYEEATMTRVLNDHRNVMVLDAFTKFYAMPGLRLGYAVSADPELILEIRRCIQPWNVSQAACLSAMTALEDTEYAEKTRRFIREQKPYIVEELSDCGLKVVMGSEAPFVMFEGPVMLREALNKRGIDIRDCSDMMKYHKINKSFYRMAVGRADDNRIVTGEIRKIVWQDR